MFLHRHRPSVSFGRICAIAILLGLPANFVGCDSSEPRVIQESQEGEFDDLMAKMRAEEEAALQARED